MTDDVMQEGQPRWVIPAIVLVAILAAIGLGVGWKGLSYAQENGQTLKDDIQTLKGSYSKDVASLQQRLAQNEKTNADLMGDLTVVTKRLQITQGQLKKAREEAQARQCAQYRIN